MPNIVKFTTLHIYMKIAQVERIDVLTLDVNVWRFCQSSLASHLFEVRYSCSFHSFQTSMFDFFFKILYLNIDEWSYVSVQKTLVLCFISCEI